MAFREARRPSTLPAHNREHTSMAAHNQVALLLLPMNVQSSSAYSSMIAKSRNIRWLKRFAAVEARSSHRAMVWRAWPVTPGGRRHAHTLDAQARDLVAFPTSAAKAAVRCPRVRADRSPADRAAIPPASAPLRGNQPWPTMLRPRFPRLSHPRLAQAIPSIACIAQVYLGETRGFRPRSRR